MHPTENPSRYPATEIITDPLPHPGDASRQRVVNQIPEMVFDDLTPVEVPVKIAGRRFVLREATETVAVMWQNLITSKASFDEDGKPKSMGNLADAEPKLVSMCLFELRQVPDGDTGRTREMPVPVPEPTVRGWPARIVKPLYDTVMRISELGGKDTEESLEKKIRDAQAKLDKLRSVKSNGRPHQGGPDPGTPGGND